MRSVGVSNRKLNAMIVLEGMLLGAVAWILAVIISFPLSMIANEMLGVLLFSCPLGFSFSIPGMFLWLLVAILSSCAASILPCRKLNRMITRDVLAYE